MDGQRVEPQHEHQQHAAQHLQHPHHRLRLGEPVRPHDRDHTGVRGDAVQHRAGEAELGAELLHELAEVERDHAVTGGDAFARLVLEHVHEPLLCQRAGLDPQLLDGRRVEQPVDRIGRRLPQRAGDGSRQRLELLRRALREVSGDVDVVVELVDQVHRQRRTHTTARLRPDITGRAWFEGHAATSSDRYEVADPRSGTIAA